MIFSVGTGETITILGVLNLFVFVAYVSHINKSAVTLKYAANRLACALLISRRPEITSDTRPAEPNTGAKSCASPKLHQPFNSYS